MFWVVSEMLSDGTGVQMRDLDERVVNMYKSIRQVLTKYRSGKLPKAFKVIPNLRNWEQVSSHSSCNVHADCKIAIPGTKELWFAVPWYCEKVSLFVVDEF